MIGARGLIAATLALWCCAVARDGFDRWIDATDLPPLGISQSVEVLDRNGDLLRAYTVEDGRWRMAVSLDAVDPAYVEMLVRYEDKRFWDHSGIDLTALSRATAQALWNGKVVSGGSTLTMQVARLLENSGTGSWRGKLRQIRVAMALERRLDKDAILTLYLNRAPFGGNIEGVRAASYAYFGKPPRRLTTAQSALLVALPQSPEHRRPDLNPGNGRAARDRVLARMVANATLSPSAGQAAMSEPAPTQRHPFPQLAAHLADRVRATDPIGNVHLTTLDARLQAQLEDLASTSVARRRDRVQVAMIVADHQTGQILASVGSAGYRADGSSGFIDLTQSRRSPGSTLKPLIYGLAFDQGLVHPETLITDRAVDFNGYRPQNFDGFYRGDIRIREALQLSLNTPVVTLLDAMGPQHLVSGLRRAGTTPIIPGGRPGLAVALGGVGLSLEDLTRLYAAIASGGTRVDLRWHPEPSPGFEPSLVLGDVAAWEIADILLQVPRPIGVMGTGIAFKTGTSYGNRDAWAIGFEGRFVVGVWMGRADGTPVPGAFGGELAAPVMFRAFQRLTPGVTPIRPPPPATLLLPNGQLPLPLQRFRPLGSDTSSDSPRLAFPPDGAIIEGGFLVARVTQGIGPFTWLANGAPLITTTRREVEIPNLGIGFSTLTVIDSNGHSARAQIEMRP